MDLQPNAHPKMQTSSKQTARPPSLLDSPRIRQGWQKPFLHLFIKRAHTCSFMIFIAFFLLLSTFCAQARRHRRARRTPHLLQKPIPIISWVSHLNTSTWSVGNSISLEPNHMRNISIICQHLFRQRRKQTPTCGIKIPRAIQIVMFTCQT